MCNTKNLDINGIEVVTKLLLLSENRRWHLPSLDFSFVKDLSDNDKKVVQSIRHIASGEMHGAAMGYLLTNMTRNNLELYNDFAEIILYLTVIVYDEFRHGLVIDSLNSAIANNDNWKENYNPRELLFDPVEVWTNPYELTTSFLTGEITNFLIYESVVKRIENEELKQLFKKIEIDERRHLAAWISLQRKMCKKEQHREGYAKAAQDGFLDVHQAEIGRYFWDGVKEANYLFDSETAARIVKYKNSIYKRMLGDKMPFTLIQLMRSHMIHIHKHIKDK
jgi:hypothetical protein